MKNTLPIVIIIAAVIIAGAFVYTKYQKCSVEICQKETSAGSQTLSSQQAADKLIKFVNDNILKGQAVASLLGVLEENGLYKVKFSVEDQEVEWQMSKDGKLVFPQVIDLATEEKKANEVAKETGQTVGNFSVTEEEVCQENGKPIVYFFGSQGCPHCVWEYPIVEEVAAKFEGYISFHNNMDSEADGEIFQKYSTGGIPTLVLGCKYYRVGSGEAAGKEQEIKDLTSLICELTNNQPAEICQE